MEKNFPRLEKLFSTLEKIFSRHEKNFSSPALIFENKLSLCNVAHAFHISPPPRCKKRCASLSSPTGNVAHGHEQRCPRPRATNRNGFRISDPAPCVIASYAQGLLGRTSPSTDTLLQLFKAMKFNGKRKSACEMLNNECKSCHCGWNAPIFAKQKPL